VDTMRDLFRSVWSKGIAGVEISITIERDRVQESIVIKTVDRNARLLSATVH